MLGTRQRVLGNSLRKDNAMAKPKKVAGNKPKRDHEWGEKAKQALARASRNPEQTKSLLAKFTKEAKSKGYAKATVRSWAGKNHVQKVKNENGRKAAVAFHGSAAGWIARALPHLLG